MDIYIVLISDKEKSSIRDWNPHYFAYDEYVTKHNLPNRNKLKGD